MLLTDDTFSRFSLWMRERTGVHLPPSKKPLLMQRLGKRLRARSLDSYEDYFEVLRQQEEEQERQIAVDLLTTHETSFFREPAHFAWLESLLQDWPAGTPLSLWCAAASTGEEVWSLAMTLADNLSDQTAWQVLASDVSLACLEQARRGHYVLERCGGIGQERLRRHCLKGVEKQAGSMLIGKALRQRVLFRCINLDQPLPPIGPFRVIFMRNVLIYFDPATKNKVVRQATAQLAPGGFLVVSHSESLYGLQEELKLVAPGVYRKP